MSPCAYVDWVEDLELGLLDGAAAARALEHLAACEDCRGARDRLAEERALFELRAAAATPPPFFASALVAGRGEPTVESRSRSSGAIRALVAVAACVAGLASSEWRVAGDAGMSAAAPDEGAEIGAERRRGHASTPASSPSASVVEEPLACALPASGVVLARADGEALACVIADRATCEERVTSSLATP